MKKRNLKRMGIGLSILISTTALLVACSAFAPCGARDMYVPAGASIQRAVDAASPGDRILLAPGQYLGNIHLGPRNSPIEFVGAGAELTIIRALRREYVVLASSGTQLQGLTVDDGEVGVWAHVDDIFVADCAFTGNGVALTVGGSFWQRPFAVERCSWVARGLAANRPMLV